MPSVVTKQAKLEHEASKSLHVNGSRHHVNKPKNVPVSAFFKKVVRLDENPVYLDPSSPLLPTTVRTTSGFFTLSYHPEGSPKRVKGKPYCLGQDMCAMRICVSGPRHLKALGKRIPEIGWILKWSYYSDDLFALAKKHPGVAFGFNVNWPAYAKMVESKAEQMGIDIDHKPFLVYITNAEKMKKLREKYQMLPPPTKEDYQSVLDETDKEMNVYGKNNSVDD